MTTGFEYRNNLLQIDKDPEAVLTYTFDWVEWLDTGDSLDTAEYTVQTRSNDPKPLLKVSNGIIDTKTYVQLSQGQLDKVYTVTVKVITNNGVTDRRNFRVRIANRSA
jgi:hypothetical protein